MRVCDVLNVFMCVYNSNNNSDNITADYCLLIALGDI